MSATSAHQQRQPCQPCQRTSHISAPATSALVLSATSAHQPRQPRQPCSRTMARHGSAKSGHRSAPSCRLCSGTSLRNEGACGARGVAAAPPALRLDPAAVLARPTSPLPIVWLGAERGRKTASGHAATLIALEPRPSSRASCGSTTPAQPCTAEAVIAHVLRSTNACAAMTALLPECVLVQQQQQPHKRRRLQHRQTHLQR